jgi:Na+/H+ antiporter NhaD/arsenite permease-like protein
MISIIVVCLVFILIATRQIGGMRLQIWQVMLGGALAIMLTGQLSLTDAIEAINIDVMLFLFGMFVVGQALEASGYLSHLANKLYKSARNVDQLVLLTLFGMGIGSALLMNDTLAIIGTPIMLNMARKYNIKSPMLLLTLAFAITTGSVLSPIGNPQNLLIAVNSSMPNPFITFLKYLLAPTLLNLGLTYFFIRLYYADQFKTQITKPINEPLSDIKLAKLSRLSLLLLVCLIIAKIVFVFLGLPMEFKLTYIALAACLPILLLSPTRVKIIKNIDWHTLTFFAAMFVLMESVWRSGFLQKLMLHLTFSPDISLSILLTSVGFSQLISNVPLVALYMPVLSNGGANVNQFIALAAGSTIAGNFLILGAASNVIIIQNAEKRSKHSLGYWEFAKIGMPLTLINILVYWVFLRLIP